MIPQLLIDSLILWRVLDLLSGLEFFSIRRTYSYNWLKSLYIYIYNFPLLLLDLQNLYQNITFYYFLKIYVAPRVAFEYLNFCECWLFPLPCSWKATKCPLARVGLGLQKKIIKFYNLN